jgi:hypothetical protein
MRLFLSSLLLAGACATPTMYRWGGYDQALYDHYKNPQDRGLFAKSMAEVVADAEMNHSRVPPGCYAEYGWALYEQGNLDQAVVYFEKESKQWPESRVLMDKLIRNATHGGGK